MIEVAIAELAPVVGVKAACLAVGESRSRHYRRHRKSAAPPKLERVAAPQPRALSEAERTAIRQVLNSDNHVDEVQALAADAQARGWIEEAERHRRLVERLDILLAEAGGQ